MLALVDRWCNRVKDYYAILGVSRSARYEEIRDAYRHLSRERHPDAGGTSEAMKELNAAWACLRDPGRRAHCDRANASSGDSSPADHAVSVDDLDRMSSEEALATFINIFGMFGLGVLNRNGRPKGFDIAGSLHYQVFHLPDAMRQAVSVMV